MSDPTRVVIVEGIFGRFVIVHADDPSVAWSGSRFVEHVDGVGRFVQVANFDDELSAFSAAVELGFEVLL